jgi:flavin reductase (DIM6/NTAB) family NADH-FMN oxidoreductase RutF
MATTTMAPTPRPATDPAVLPPVLAVPGHQDADRFREAMSHLASGVVLVTASLGGRPWGMTVSSACPICTDPPTMLVSLSSHTALSKAVAASGRFGVNVLGIEALEIARFGSAVGAPKFLDEGVGLELGEDHPAAAVVAGALSHVDCDVVEQVVHGTHSIFLGRVRQVTVQPGPGPLVHYRRAFRQLDAGA